MGTGPEGGAVTLADAAGASLDLNGLDQEVRTLGGGGTTAISVALASPFLANQEWDVVAWCAVVVAYNVFRIVRPVRFVDDVTSIVLPKSPYPDGETVEKIRLATAKCDAVIAVGSGTINDLCKYGSAQDKKPYAVFATAPSMNGYTSVNAAITVHGHKMSLAAQAPMGAFFDLAVLAAAPARWGRACGPRCSRHRDTPRRSAAEAPARRPLAANASAR